MHKVFSLPQTTDFKWVESNDAQVGLSEIEVFNGKCRVPYHIYEDSLLDDVYLEQYAVEAKTYIEYPEHCLDDIQQARMESYKACIWYPEINGKIPTVKAS